MGCRLKPSISSTALSSPLTCKLTPAERIQLFRKVEPTMRRQRLDELLKRIRRQTAQHAISDKGLKRICDEVRQELYDERAPRRH